MNYYEKNRESIKVNKPSFYKQIFEEKTIERVEESDNIKTTQSKDGENILQIVWEGKDYRLNSAYRPNIEAEKWAEQYDFLNMNMVITMFGFGNGIFVKAIEDKLKKEDFLLIYEPSRDVFFHVMEKYDLTSIFASNNIHLYIEDINDHEFGNSLKAIIGIANYKNQIHCFHPQYDSIFVESYKEFLKHIQEGYTFVGTNITTQKYFSKLFIENNLKNLEFLKESTTFHYIKNIIPNHAPAILVAAGPSVEENIPYLKKAKGKAIIFAVDRILDYLLENEIEPDFVITVDPEKTIEHFSTKENITIPLICYGESNHDILKHHKGKKILCSKSLFLEEIFRLTNNPIPSLLPSGSVALIGFSACVDLGFKKIILVGQDLAYDGDKSHGGNTVENNLIQKDVLVEGINGDMIRSRTDWQLFITRYRDLIQIAKDVEVIDAKLRGAKIKGTTNMLLEDAIEKYCVEKLDWESKKVNETQCFNEQSWKIAYDYLTNGQSELNMIYSKTNNALELSKKILELYRKKTDEQYKINKYNKKLQNINSFVGKIPFYDLINMNITPTIANEISHIYQFSDDYKKDEIKVIEAARMLYRTTLETIEYVRPLLDEAIKKLK